MNIHTQIYDFVMSLPPSGKGSLRSPETMYHYKYERALFFVFFNMD